MPDAESAGSSCRSFSSVETPVRHSAGRLAFAAAPVCLQFPGRKAEAAPPKPLTGRAALRVICCSAEPASAAAAVSAGRRPAPLNESLLFAPGPGQAGAEQTGGLPEGAAKPESVFGAR